MPSLRLVVNSVTALTLFAFGCGGSAETGGAGGQLTTGTTSTGTTITATGTSTGTETVTTATWTSSGTTSSSASSSSSSGGDAGPPASGDCHADSDCPGGHCVAITKGGFLVCQTAPVPTTTCGSAQDQCCPTQPCAGGAACLAGPLVPVCAGIPMEPFNQCAIDQCGQDADCLNGQICGLAGTLGRQIRACLPAGCKVDADCTAAPGGICAPVKEPCCGTSAGLACVYPAAGCRQNADCGDGQYCQPDGTTAVCKAGAPICPA